MERDVQTTALAYAMMHSVVIYKPSSTTTSTLLSQKNLGTEWERERQTFTLEVVIASSVIINKPYGAWSKV